MNKKDKNKSNFNERLHGRFKKHEDVMGNLWHQPVVYD